jgi:plastocyanin
MGLQQVSGNRRGWLFGGLLAALLAVGCGASDGSGTGDGPGDTGNGTGGTGVRVGNDFFRSGHNASTNPAVDTVAVGDSLTWMWVNTGGVEHSIQSLGATAFPSSAIQSGNGKTYQVVFQTPGTFRYNCAVHGNEMTGTIVVQ